MRVRATRGLRITNFYGNYFIRGTDLLALPNCTPDSVFAVEFGYDEQLLTASVVSVQVRNMGNEVWRWRHAVDAEEGKDYT